MVFLHRNAKTFRAERVPLCYMRRFPWASTETRKIIKEEERSIRFLDDKGLVRQMDCLLCSRLFSYNSISRPKQPTRTRRAIGRAWSEAKQAKRGSVTNSIALVFLLPSSTPCGNICSNQANPSMRRPCAASFARNCVRPPNWNGVRLRRTRNRVRLELIRTPRPGTPHPIQPGRPRRALQGPRHRRATRCLWGDRHPLSTQLAMPVPPAAYKRRWQTWAACGLRKVTFVLL